MLLNRFPGGGVSIEAATATPSKVLAPYTFFAGENEEIQTGSIPSKGAATITPGASNQIIAAGQYLSGDQTIAGDADLIPANIRTGKNIFGVDGTGPGMPASIVAGDTPIKVVYGEQVRTSTAYADVPERIFTAQKAGVYRIIYDANASDSSRTAKSQLLLNGVAIANSELQTNSGVKAMDVALAAGDVIKQQWCMTNSETNRAHTHFMLVSIQAVALQTEINNVVT